VLLAIDTSTALASVALYDGRVLAEATWIAGQDHSRQLLPRIEDLLGAVQRSKADLTAVGVALGPGSFNGLRVGITTAKALAFARGLPIVGIETLRVTAYPFRLAGRPIRPLYDAGRDEVATGLYQASAMKLATLEEPRIATLDDALDASPSSTFFCGELRPAWREKIADRFGPERVARPAEAPRRAGYLAELAWEQVRAGAGDAVATLQPIYLRRPPVHQGVGALGSAAR
jgi:tRNA threonylcarbamoyladenosine biosynthesis protein TsaB